MNRLAADNYLSIPKLKASTERELGNPILPMRFQAILYALRKQRLVTIDGDQVSRRVQ